MAAPVRGQLGRGAVTARREPPWRLIVFVAGTAMVALAFSGRWIVGRDSALYRAVGQAIATGDGYEFRGEPERLIHPGYPLVLAGLARVDGVDLMTPIAPLVLNAGVAVGLLLVVHALLRSRQPARIAGLATLALAVNPVWLRASCEVRPDLLFTFAVVATWWGRERLAARGARDVVSAAVVVVALAAGWLLHPAFWLVVVTLVVDATAAIRGGSADRRVASLVAGIALAVGAVAIALDPRTGGFAPFDGAYERLLLGKLADPAALRLPDHLAELIADAVPRAVLGFGDAAVIGTLATCAVAATIPAIDVRAWRLYVVVAAVAAVVIGANPRYLLPVLPFLFVGILRGCEAPGRPRWVFPAVTAALLGAGTIASGQIVLAQRGAAAPLDADFARHVAIAPHLASELTPSDLVLASEPRILSYLSGRRVVGPGELADRLGELPPPGTLRGHGFTHVVLAPEPTGDAYLDAIRAVVDAEGWTVTPVASAGGLVLCRLDAAP